MSNQDQLALKYTIPKFFGKPIPGELMAKAAALAAKMHGMRIRGANKTIHGDSIDPNFYTWREFKATGTLPKAEEPETAGFGSGAELRKAIISQKPLVMTGAMSDAKLAFSIKATATGFTLTMQGAARDHARSVIEIGDETGRNWRQAFGLGEFEVAAILKLLMDYVDKESLITAKQETNL